MKKEKNIEDKDKELVEIIETENFEVSKTGSLADDLMQFENINDIKIENQEVPDIEVQEIYIRETGNYLNLQENFINIPIEMIYFPFFTPQKQNKRINFKYTFEDLGVTMYSTLIPKDKKDKVFQPSIFEEKIYTFLISMYQEKTNKKTQVIEGMLEITGTDLTAEQFSMIKIVLSALFMAIALIVCKIFNLGMLYLVAVMAAVGLIAIILPNSWLKSKAKKRKEKLRQQLPDIMDLLVVSVEAGLGFDAALIRLYEKDKSELMTELMQATRDIQHGMSKKEAYEGLAKRCGVKELTTFLTALIQADQLGISIKSVLKVQAENLRKDRKMRAEEKALKAPVTMLVPMVLFIFPVIFIVLLGPAVINIMDIFG